ncbi:MAG TPA: SDR family oxidoreductase [Candidatus Binataceae bacterium]|nr:SDR family oxidoreductase [Candidatus Binataceae bacterium]
MKFFANRLAGRVVLITGASSGIGAAAMRLFAAEGGIVAGGARRIDRVESIVAELRRLGHKASAVECDVRDEDSVKHAVEFVAREHGRLDCAFNNAGVGGAHQMLHEISTKKFDQVIETNLRGVFLCMKHEIPAMLANGGGAIVNTSSIGGLIGSSHNSDYAASKFGLAGLTRCAALGYARMGIRVNAIAPGPTRSEMFDRWIATEEAREQMAELMPIKYIADPDDMARAALFLLSDESRWTTGTVLPCEGGRAAG